MASFNRVILIGNLTRDPELRYIPSGTAVCEVGMAMNDRRKGPNGDWIEETTFVDVTLWGRTAEVVSEYCAKGQPLFVEGRLKLDTWEKEGKKNYRLRVVGDRIQLMGSKGGGGGGPSGGGGGGGARGRAQSGGPPQYDEDYGVPDEPSYSEGPPSRGAPSRGAPPANDDIPF